MDPFLKFIAAIVAAIVIAIALARILGYLASVRRRIVPSLGAPLRRLHDVTSSHEAWEGPDLALALERLAQREGARKFPFRHADAASIRGVLEGAALTRGGSSYVVATGPDSVIEVPENVAYVFDRDQPAWCAVLTRVDHHGRPRVWALGTIASSPDRARWALDHVVQDARARSIYRGKAITLSASAVESERFDVQFQPLAPATRDDIVLPTPVIDVIERNTIRFLEASDRLRDAGRSLRQGVLLHGVPGVGKTLVVRWIASAREGLTAVLLTGRNLRFVRESLRIAELLAPSVVVFEDVDLVAGERTSNHAAGVLHELLDELDGIGPRTPCLVLLTTNRPDVLEPALALRAGRVDQAVEFPLPDADCRRRLIELAGRGLDLREVSIDRWVVRLDGATPAFIVELLRRATLMCVERGDRALAPSIAPIDLDRAFDELSATGGSLTRRLFGFTGATRSPG